MALFVLKHKITLDSAIQDAISDKEVNQNSEYMVAHIISNLSDTITKRESLKRKKYEDDSDYEEYLEQPPQSKTDKPQISLKKQKRNKNSCEFHRKRHWKCQKSCPFRIKNAN